MFPLSRPRIKPPLGRGEAPERKEVKVLIRERSKAWMGVVEGERYLVGRVMWGRPSRVKRRGGLGWVSVEGLVSSEIRAVKMACEMEGSEAPRSQRRVRERFGWRGMGS